MPLGGETANCDIGPMGFLAVTKGCSTSMNTQRFRRQCSICMCIERTRILLFTSNYPWGVMGTGGAEEGARFVSQYAQVLFEPLASRMHSCVE